jgi:two-component system, OmpR family, sensor histidine kinase KdpD
VDFVSHGFRTPLMVIKSNGRIIEMMASGVLRAEAVRPLAKDIQTSADRLQRAIDDLLELYEGEHAGPPRAPARAQRLGDLLKRALTEAGLESHEPPVALDLPPALPPVLVDPALLERALERLLAYAASHFGREAPLRIGARAEAGAVHLTITAELDGLSTDEARWILGGFAEERPARAASSSAGLGLHLAKCALEGFGATVKVVEAAHPRGCGFEIALEGARDPEIHRDPDPEADPTLPGR